MASKVAIMNMAAQKCGAKRIQSPDEGSLVAREMSAAWDIVRQSVLRMYRWNFAKGRAELAASATAPLMGWTYQSPVPADFLGLIGIFTDNFYQQQYTDTKSQYVLENNGSQQVIMSELNPLYIVYTKDVTDTAQFDATFDQVLACHLALHLQYKLSLGLQRVAQIQKELDYWERKAKMSDAIENTPEVIQSSEWVDSRWSGDDDLRRGPVS